MEELELKNILVVSRLTPYCREAVRMGISLAKKYQAKIQILYLPSKSINLGGGAVNAPGIIFPSDESKNYASVEEQAQDELNQALRNELAPDIPVRTIIRDGKPLEEIAKVVKEEKIDILLMVASEEGRLEQLLFSQESVAIIRSLPCSILLVKRELREKNW